METTRESASGVGAKEHQRFFELARSFDTAMLVTHRSDGTSHARPMALAEISDQGDMWFVTREHTPKVDEVKQDERTLIVAQQSGKYLTVTGQAEVQRDARRLQEVWSDKWRTWIGDKDDPELVLLCVHPLEGEYWDTSGTQGLKYVAKAAAAYVTGKTQETPQSDPNAHGKVPLS